MHYATYVAKGINMAISEALARQQNYASQKQQSPSAKLRHIILFLKMSLKDVYRIAKEQHQAALRSAPSRHSPPATATTPTKTEVSEAPKRDL